MRAIMIDPHVQVVHETDIPDGNASTIADAIDCRWVEYVGLGGAVAMWVDEEGFLGNQEHQKYFYFNVLTGQFPIAGKALITGLSPGGNTIAAFDDVQVDYLREVVTFVNGIEELQALIAEGRVRRPAVTVTTTDGAGAETTTTEWELPAS